MQTKTLWIGFTARADMAGGVVGGSPWLSRFHSSTSNHLNIIVVALVSSRHYKAIYLVQARLRLTVPRGLGYSSTPRVVSMAFSSHDCRSRHDDESRIGRATNQLLSPLDISNGNRRCSARHEHRVVAASLQSAHHNFSVDNGCLDRSLNNVRVQPVVCCPTRRKTIPPCACIK